MEKLNALSGKYIFRGEGRLCYENECGVAKKQCKKKDICGLSTLGCVASISHRGFEEKGALKSFRFSREILYRILATCYVFFRLHFVSSQEEERKGIRILIFSY